MEWYAIICQSVIAALEFHLQEISSRSPEKFTWLVVYHGIPTPQKHMRSSTGMIIQFPTELGKIEVIFQSRTTR